MEFISYSIDLILILFIVGIAAGIIDTLAGVGGLVALPALMLTGIPPIQALATNKIQSVVGTGTATAMMILYRKIKIKDIIFLMITAFFFSLFGTILIQFFKTDSLVIIIPLVLLSILTFFLFSKSLNKIESIPRLSKRKYNLLVIPFIGLYDGMFGPGTGSFFTASGISMRGHNLINATAIAKALNFSTNVGAVIIFVYLGQVVWPLGISMIIGQFIGARIGSKALIKINPSYLRVIVIILCTLMLIKYIASL